LSVLSLYHLIFILFVFLFYFRSTSILEWRLSLLRRSVYTQFLVNFLNVFFFQTWMFNYLYTFLVYSFMNFSFNILLLKVNNFIEYSFIINLKTSVYNFSSLITKSYSTNFFKNLFFTVITVFLILSFITYINIDKCLLLLFGFYTFCISYNTKK
jgi:hypothetical protein